MNDLDIQVSLPAIRKYQQNNNKSQPKFKNLQIENFEEKNDSFIDEYNDEIDLDNQNPQERKMQKKHAGFAGELQLNQSAKSLEAATMSYELGSQGFKVHKEGYEIGATGMMDIRSGQMIVGNLSEEDLDYGEERIILGNGASGYVYLAQHRSTGIQMALKQINVFDQGKRKQLINDLRSLQKHECPFLIQFLGALFGNGSVKVALEYMDLGSLKSLIKLAIKKDGKNIKENRPLIPEAVASKIFQQILCGLAYLNVCLKQMHRDIKPDNILLNKKGFVKVTDFGISKQYDGDETEKARTFLGTMTYMSPERMQGEKYSYAGDIWSLGIMLIETVTGKFPFKDTKGFLEILEQISEHKSPNVPKNGNFSPELYDFIERCLKKNPDERDSTHELLAHPWILKYSQTQANLPKYFKYLSS